MRIPMRGEVGSLNAAVAGSILLFEALAPARPPRPATTPKRAAAQHDEPEAHAIRGESDGPAPTGGDTPPTVKGLTVGPRGRVRIDRRTGDRRRTEASCVTPPQEEPRRGGQDDDDHCRTDSETVATARPRR